MSETDRFGGAGQKRATQRAVKTPDERGALFKQRKAALVTPYAGVLIAHGVGVATAEQRASSAVAHDWKSVRAELEALGWDYWNMEWSE